MDGTIRLFGFLPDTKIRPQVVGTADGWTKRRNGLIGPDFAAAISGGRSKSSLRGVDCMVPHLPSIANTLRAGFYLS
jgi:hypothetical protein